MGRGGGGVGGALRVWWMAGGSTTSCIIMVVPGRRDRLPPSTTATAAALTIPHRAATRQRGAAPRTVCSPAWCRTAPAPAGPPGWAPGGAGAIRGWWGGGGGVQGEGYRGTGEGGSGSGSGGITVSKQWGGAVGRRELDRRAPLPPQSASAVPRGAAAPQGQQHHVMLHAAHLPTTHLPGM